MNSIFSYRVSVRVNRYYFAGDHLLNQAPQIPALSKIGSTYASFHPLGQVLASKDFIKASKVQSTIAAIHSARVSAMHSWWLELSISCNMMGVSSNANRISAKLISNNYGCMRHPLRTDPLRSCLSSPIEEYHAYLY